MADVTLQSIYDAVQFTQSELNDLAIRVSDHDTRIQTNSADIVNLQNPATGVPPELLAWFGLGHSIREVDSILDSDINTIDTHLSTHDTNITDLQTGLATETSSRISAVSDLQTQIDSATSDITNLDAELTQEIADRGALASSMASQYTTLNSRIDDVQADLTTLSTDTGTDTTSLYSSVSSINAALQVIQTQILQLQNIGVDPLGAQASQITSLTAQVGNNNAALAFETSARTSADNALQAALITNSTSMTAFQSQLDTESDDRIAADNAINALIGTINTTLSGHTALISSETAARIAADITINSTLSTHTTQISDNANNISTEITNRANADTALQSQITTNTGNISTNTANIASNTTAITGLKAHYGIVKDGGGYVTSWRINDDSLAAGNFNLRNLNNDARLQNPGYVGKYFPAVSVSSFAPATTYDTQYGTGPSTNFQGTDTNNYTRNVNVYATASVGINGSVFQGVDYSTGGNLNRLGQDLTTFKVNFSGYTNGQLSLWYRIKANPTDNTQRWFPISMATIAMPSPRTYEMASGRAVVQISVTANQVIEFGLTNLNTLDASRSASNTIIYNGAVTVEAYNLVTIL